MELHHESLIWFSTFKISPCRQSDVDYTLLSVFVFNNCTAESLESGNCASSIFEFWMEFGVLSKSAPFL